MKTSHIFWGTLFIVLGILILANNFSTINLYWDNLWQYWPLVLVLLGVSMLVKNVAGKSIIAGAAAVVLALVIFASVNFTTSYIFDDNFEVDIGPTHLVGFKFLMGLYWNFKVSLSTLVLWKKDEEGEGSR